MHLSDFAVLFVILVWLGAAVRYIIRRKKAGRGICGGDCTGCKAACAQRRCETD